MDIELYFRTQLTLALYTEGEAKSGTEYSIRLTICTILCSIYTGNLSCAKDRMPKTFVSQSKLIVRKFEGNKRYVQSMWESLKNIDWLKMFAHSVHRA